MGKEHACELHPMRRGPEKGTALLHQLRRAGGGPGPAAGKQAGDGSEPLFRDSGGSGGPRRRRREAAAPAGDRNEEERQRIEPGADDLLGAGHRRGHLPADPAAAGTGPEPEPRTAERPRAGEQRAPDPDHPAAGDRLAGGDHPRAGELRAARHRGSRADGGPHPCARAHAHTDPGADPGGRIFKTPEIAAYFNTKSWYKGTVSPENFNEKVLNQYEWANISFIRDYENKYYGGSYY